MSGITLPLAANVQHDFSLACRENEFSDGDFAIDSPYISVVMIGPG